MSQTLEEIRGLIAANDGPEPYAGKLHLSKRHAEFLGYDLEGGSAASIDLPTLKAAFNQKDEELRDKEETFESKTAPVVRELKGPPRAPAKPRGTKKDDSNK